MENNLFDENRLEDALAALRQDYAKLSPRIRQIKHEVKSKCSNVNLHLHYPTLRQGKATISELVQVLFDHLIHFWMPRSEINRLMDQYGKIDGREFGRLYQVMGDAASRLFKKANRATNRNGEVGELLLYLMTEWVLNAPQLVAKMSLKTNAEMPIHGSDGIHVKYCTETSRLIFFWGESKIYKNVNDAIVAAVKSIKEALLPEKMAHELQLVQNNLCFSGMSVAARNSLLDYLNPYSENSNKKLDVSTCLIGFDYEEFSNNLVVSGKVREADFERIAAKKLEALSKSISSALTAAGLDGHSMEIFLFPVPSVKDVRDLFQDKIGWSE